MSGERWKIHVYDENDQSREYSRGLCGVKLKVTESGQNYVQVNNKLDPTSRSIPLIESGKVTCKRCLSILEYRSVPHTRVFTVRVAGVSHYPDAVSRCFVGQTVRLVREPNNPHDKNAIRCDASGSGTIGHIERDEAKFLAEDIDGGSRVLAVIHAFVGGDRYRPNIGVIIQVTLTTKPL